jgi:predicted RNA binding protein YcfA (HicA-like mRNA interferase family)
VYDTESVKGSEFLRKARSVARSKKLTCKWVPSHGKGSHGTLYVGPRAKTTVQDLKREIPTGTLRAMIEQLELEAKDFGLR